MPLKVLFDFEIDEHVEHPHSHEYYEVVREFFFSRYSLFELELNLYVADGEFAIMVICVSEKSVKIISVSF